MLLKASNQTDLENWVTAIHSASASLLAKRQGKEDTVRLLRSQVRGLLQKIDMDGKMKKMAELQLTVVCDPKNRKAIENQVMMILTLILAGIDSSVNENMGCLCRIFHYYALYISSLGEKFHRKSGGLLYSIDRSGGVTYALFMLNYDP